MTVELSCSSPIGDDAVTPLMMVSIWITIGDIILLRPQSKHRSNVCMHHLLNCLIEQLRDGLKIVMCCCHVTPSVWISNLHNNEPLLIPSRVPTTPPLTIVPTPT